MTSSFIDSTFLREKVLTPEEPQSNYNCLTDQTLLNLKSDLKRIEQLSNKRLQEIKDQILFSNRPECEVSVQDFSEIQRKLIFVEMQLLNTAGSCFTSEVLDKINDTVKTKLGNYSEAELDEFSRSLTRNTVKCNSSAKEKTQELLTIIVLEKEKRLWETVPKSVEERSRLDLLSEEANIKKELIDRKKELPNQTLSEISTNYSKNTLGLLDDILNPNENFSYKDNIVSAFQKDDRLLYFGITVIAFSMFISIVK